MSYPGGPELITPFLSPLPSYDSTQKGFFKKPDWDIAAQYYEKAGR